MGVMGNQIIFPETNPLPRNLFACGQMRQAVSLYHSNYQTRIDKMGVVLNYGQIPLVKTRYLDKICKEQHPYGENVIAAIMCYGGYNVEDSILFNEGSLKRGLFRTTYYNMYETREESSKIGGSQIDSRFTNIEKSNVTGKRSGFDYSDLDEYGLIKENTPLHDKKILIGKVTTNQADIGTNVDDSVVPKKGQHGFVDKSFITEGEEGFRLAKVRVRDERVPNIGDKFCSRCGQKGTMGLIIPEEDMPFTKDGIRPDIIINPHALPSRMTIGQLVETLMGKACAMYGGFGDCTAFMNKGEKTASFGKMLTNVGLHSSGNQKLMNGEHGEQMQSEIFIGPTYYMRLKHMVKDKINYRSKGPRAMLTRQTVQGRANDGGLRIGEMERDGVAGHGAMHFLQESMMERGDLYYMAICNVSGMTAIYNQSNNLFISPMADGPIKFTGTIDSGMNIENISKYGRSFSVIRIPYAFKLLMQELQTMNIQMRLITEDNIDQLTSMAFSNNIIKLTGDPLATPSQIAKTARMDMSKYHPKVLKESPAVEISEPVKDSSKEYLAYGWIFDRSDMDSGDIYKSLIIDSSRRPTDLWKINDHDYTGPKDHPSGWKSGDLIKSDGSIIPDETIVEALIVDQSPDNWTRVINRLNPPKLIMRTGVVPPPPPDSPPYTVPDSPPYTVPNSPPYTVPDSPPYNASDSPPYNASDSPPYTVPDSPPIELGGKDSITNTMSNAMGNIKLSIGQLTGTSGNNPVPTSEEAVSAIKLAGNNITDSVSNTLGNVKSSLLQFTGTTSPNVDVEDISEKKTVKYSG